MRLLVRKSGRLFETALMRAFNLLISSLVFGLVGCSGAPDSTGEKPATDDQHVASGVAQTRYRADLRDDDYALGGSEPLVTIVVFSDYACPPCARSWQVLEHLVEDYGNDVRVVFRGLTMLGFAEAERALEAAFAAGAQGQFWPMHRRIFADMRLDRTSLRQHAADLGLDLTRFLEDLDDGVFASMRAQHRRLAVELGISFGPVALVNGRAVVGFRDESAWHALINEELVHARSRLVAGVPRAGLYNDLQANAVTAAVALDEAAQAAGQELAARLTPDLTRLPDDFEAAVPGRRYDVPVDGAVGRGPESALVTIVAFMDYECPHCKRAAVGLDELQARFPDDMRLVFRHLPLPSHRAADGAARAAVAADQQGQFWAMNEQLWAADRLHREAFIAAATAIGLDRERFIADLDAPEAATRVREDMLLARRLGLEATPAFFLNGRFVSGFRGVDVLAADIAAELLTAKQLLADGVPRAELTKVLLAPEAKPVPQP